MNALTKPQVRGQRQTTNDMAPWRTLAQSKAVGPETQDETGPVFVLAPQVLDNEFDSRCSDCPRHCDYDWVYCGTAAAN